MFRKFNNLASLLLGYLVFLDNIFRLFHLILSRLLYQPCMGEWMKKENVCHNSFQMEWDIF